MALQVNSRGDTIIYSKKLLPLLFILPVIYGVFASIYLYQTKAFFTTYTDSTYIYLINGMNIAGGNFAIGHYDNPGTTAHWLAGIIIFIAHLFIGKNSVSQDVLSNPELYLKICGGVCVCLLILSVFASGRLIFKNTNNLYSALFFQLIPVSSYLATLYMVRICPEYLMLIILPYYCAYLWVLCFKRDSVNNLKPILFLSFVTAALIVGKITCLPFLIIPVFFIKSISKKALYLFITFVFGMLLLFPVWPNIRAMYHWFLDLATHTGIYGGGIKGIIDTNTYMQNIKTIFKTELFFSTGYILISIAIVTGFLQKKRKDNFYKLTLAFWIIITAQIIITAKHYEYHYMLPAQLLTIPCLLSAYKSVMPNTLNNAFKLFILLVCCLFLIYKMSRCALEYDEGNKMYESSLVVKKYASAPKIITTSYEGSCFQESALHFGSAYGGSHFQDNYAVLRNKYPNSYFYAIGPNYIQWFKRKVASFELFKKHPKLLIYFLRQDENTEKNSLKNIIAGNDSLIKSIKLIEQNNNTGEDFYLVSIDTAKANTNHNKELNIVCDFEKTTPDKSAFISADGLFYFEDAILQSTDKSFSGSSSIKLSPQNQKVCSATFLVKPSAMFDISVNCYSEDIVGGIMLSAADGTVYKQSNAVLKDYGNGWKRISLKATVPANYPDKEINFNLSYYGKKTCYFDDLSISYK